MGFRSHLSVNQYVPIPQQQTQSESQDLFLYGGDSVGTVRLQTVPTIVNESWDSLCALPLQVCGAHEYLYCHAVTTIITCTHLPLHKTPIHAPARASRANSGNDLMYINITYAYHTLQCWRHHPLVHITVPVQILQSIRNIMQLRVHRVLRTQAAIS